MAAMPDRSMASGAARNRGAASANGSRRADAGNCGRVWGMEAGRPMKPADAPQARRGGRADAGNCGGAWGMEGRRPMKPAQAPQARRSGRADAGNCGAVQRTKTATAETGGNGRGAGRWMNAGGAKAV